jgi:serine/threonine-protein kinase
MTVALLVIIFGVSAAGVMYFALRGRTVEVPSIVGKTESDAEIELEDYGLRMGIKNRVHHDKIPLKVIIDQSPVAGTIVKTGQLVRVSVSLGAATQ